jgi:hypothetical protein
MASRYKEAVAPAYLFLCLLFGGSAQGIWQNMILQLLGLAIIAWAAWRGAGPKLNSHASQLLVIALLGIAWVAMQTAPLPPSLWAHAGGRKLILEGYRILGVAVPWLPLSVTPYRSLDSLFGLLPPLAIFVAIVSLGAYRPTWIAAVLLLGGVGSVLLGALQVTASGNIADWTWYPFPETSYGLATGFFANANHMAILLLCALPFLAAMLASRPARPGERNTAPILAATLTAILIIAGIALNRSLAVFALIPPVLAASALVFLPPGSAWRRWVAIAAALSAVAAVAGLAATSLGTREGGGDTSSSVESRQEMLTTTVEAMRDFLPWGSGLGSFRSVYQLHEDPARVDNAYVPHAHNDYVELALETGIPGIVLMIAFLAWWVRATFRVWRDAEGWAYARAASIASGAILIHSAVDFPLRTAAVAALFATCLALLTERPRPRARSSFEWRPARHVVIE